MDEKLKNIILDLRAMESGHAASWLISFYPIRNPDYGEVFQLLRARSWKRADQLRLARYYLQKIPFASEKPYDAFISFMSLKSFISVLREFSPTSKADADLLMYHLKTTLQKAAQTSDDHDAINAFFDDLSSV